MNHNSHFPTSNGLQIYKLQRFNGDGDVSVWRKILEWDIKQQSIN